MVPHVLSFFLNAAPERVVVTLDWGILIYLGRWLRPASAAFANDCPISYPRDCTKDERELFSLTDKQYWCDSSFCCFGQQCGYVYVTLMSVHHFQQSTFNAFFTDAFDLSCPQ